MTEVVDRDIAVRLAVGRGWVSRNVLAPLGDRLVLIDRWYPSDAVFRSWVAFDDCLAFNRAAGVVEPDLVVAVQCAPDEAWRRALGRPRGLDSRVVTRYPDHLASCERFAEIGNRHSWWAVSTDRAPGEVAEEVADAVDNSGLFELSQVTPGEYLLNVAGQKATTPVTVKAGEVVNVGDIVAAHDH